MGNGGGKTTGDAHLFCGFGEPRRRVAGDAAELTNGLGEFVVGRAAAANGVGTPPATGALTGITGTAAGLIPGFVAALGSLEY